MQSDILYLIVNTYPPYGEYSTLQIHTIILLLTESMPSTDNASLNKMLMYVIPIVVLVGVLAIGILIACLLMQKRRQRSRRRRKLAEESSGDDSFIKKSVPVILEADTKYPRIGGHNGAGRPLIGGGGGGSGYDDADAAEDTDSERLESPPPPTYAASPSLQRQQQRRLLAAERDSYS